MKTFDLKVPADKVRSFHKSATPELKVIFEASAPAGFFSQKVTERVRTYEAACEENGELPIDEQAYRTFFREQLTRQCFPADRIDAEIHSKLCLIKMETITRAWNSGKVADWMNTDQRKYVPWFDASAGCAFYYTCCACSCACAGGASRLCFIGENDDETRARAAEAGKLFIEYYKGIIL